MFAQEPYAGSLNFDDLMTIVPSTSSVVRSSSWNWSQNTQMSFPYIDCCWTTVVIISAGCTVRITTDERPSP